MLDHELPSLQASYAQAFPELSLAWKASSFPAPQVVVVDHDQAARAGLDPEWLESPRGASFLVGDLVAPGSSPVAMIYAGHQFGGYSPRLGDGRALLLGELVVPDHGSGLAALRDLHLKGSGRTPLARGGDGFARLGPMLREYVLATAMGAMGIASTGSLAVVSTGQEIERSGPAPGAVLARVAASHIRVGTFEYAARLGDPGLVDRLIDYSLERHFDGVHDDVDIPAVRLLRGVIDRQASLVASWMLVGFIHGVMNTDNVAISGETIDYGPCAFLEAYSPKAVFSSIDHGGRYAFGNQPGIAQWNLTRFAETLIGAMGDDSDVSIGLATDELDRFVACYRAAMATGMAAKLGLSGAVGPDESDAVNLGEELLALMEGAGADFTTTFRALSSELVRDDSGDQSAGADATLDWLRNSDAGSEWLVRWRAQVHAIGAAPQNVAASMDAVNPVYVPRNHIVEEALDAAESGDLEPFTNLVEVVSDPFVIRRGADRYAEPAPASYTDTYQTFCGT